VLGARRRPSRRTGGRGHRRAARRHYSAGLSFASSGLELPEGSSPGCSGRRSVSLRRKRLANLAKPTPHTPTGPVNSFAASAAFDQSDDSREPPMFRGSKVFLGRGGLGAGSSSAMVFSLLRQQAAAGMAPAPLTCKVRSSRPDKRMDNRASECGVRPETTACIGHPVANSRPCLAGRVGWTHPRRDGAETKTYRARRTLGCGPSEVCAKKRSVLLALDAELSVAAAGDPRDRHVCAAGRTATRTLCSLNRCGYPSTHRGPEPCSVALAHASMPALHRILSLVTST
jgi:hypothetical protein